MFSSGKSQERKQEAEDSPFGSDLDVQKWKIFSSTQGVVQESQRRKPASPKGQRWSQRRKQAY